MFLFSKTGKIKEGYKRTLRHLDDESFSFPRKTLKKVMKF